MKVWLLRMTVATQPVCSSFCPPDLEKSGASFIYTYPNILSSHFHHCVQQRKLLHDLDSPTEAFSIAVTSAGKAASTSIRNPSSASSALPTVYTDASQSHCARIRKMSINWVMLDGPQSFVRLPREIVLFTSPPRTSLTLQTPNSYPGKEPLSIKSSDGIAIITNQRVRPIPLLPQKTTT